MLRSMLIEATVQTTVVAAAGGPRLVIYISYQSQ